MKLPFLKKIRGLRPVKAKPRKPGYYYVQWSFSFAPEPKTKTGENNFWRIAYYNGSFWWMAGDTRPYYDYSFIKISNRQVSAFPWLQLSRWLLWVTGIFCLLSMTMSILNLIKAMK